MRIKDVPNRLSFKFLLGQERQPARAILGAVAVAAMGFGAAPAMSFPLDYYDTGIRIPVPPDPNINFVGNPQGTGGVFTSYDISWFDGTTQLMYLADRSNASVDIFSAKTNSFVGRIGGAVNGVPTEFVGLFPPAVTAKSGPNGVVVGDSGGPNGSHNLYAGDGNSTLKGYNIGGANFNALVGNPAAPVIPTPNAPGSTLRLPNTPYPTGAPDQNRVDEMAFGRLDPNNSRLLVANNAATPPFATILNTSNNSNSLVSKVTFDGTGGVNGPPKADAVEQAAYVNGKFYINVDTPTGPGGVARIDAATGVFEKFFDFSTMIPTNATSAPTICAPTGLAVGSGGKMVVGCGPSPTGSILFDPNANGGNGSIKLIPISGEDEVWFDPVRQLYFLSARTDLGGVPLLGIYDAVTETLTQKLTTSTGAHSVAVDPVSGEAFVAYGGIGRGGVASSVCPLGCIAVFAVPEPTSLALLGTSLVGLVGFGLRRRRRSS